MLAAIPLTFCNCLAGIVMTFDFFAQLFASLCFDAFFQYHYFVVFFFFLETSPETFLIMIGL